MPWKDSADFINDQTFDPDWGAGETFVYYSNHGTGDPQTITAIRMRRSPDEFNRAGAFEGIEIQEKDFASPPAVGDVVVVDENEYVITALRDADPYNLTRVLVLNRRQRAPSA
jgi:hypothetical protein